MNISALLLAGGESRRMGRDKAIIAFRGKPLWQHQIDLLRSLDPVEILLSARTEPAWQPPGIRFVSDQAPSRGPISGLAAALKTSRSTHLLALAVDMPLMTRSFLISLCDEIGLGRGVLPVIGHRAEPLAAVYPDQALSLIDAALAGNDFSLRHLTEELVARGLLRLIDVLPAQEQLFRSLNSPLDIEELECARP